MSLLFYAGMKVPSIDNVRQTILNFDYQNISIKDNYHIFWIRIFSQQQTFSLSSDSIKFWNPRDKLTHKTSQLNEKIQQMIHNNA